MIDIISSLAIAAGVVAVVVGAFAAWNAVLLIFNLLFVGSPLGWIAIAVAAVVFIIITLVRHWGSLNSILKTFFKIALIGLGILFPPLGALLIAIKLISIAWGKIFGSGDKKLTAEVDEKRTIAGEIKAEGENGAGVKGENGNIVTPQIAQTEATTSMLEKTNETIEKSSAEITIKDETGKAEVTKTTGAPDSFKMDLPAAWGLA